ncbi:MAG TPA: SgcJ/EcaC family oxidoreductase [Pyrinomonadaceae bacterium]|nr:SgcJ/EcaC family oxidoreductase [Pyrinomonadaceae bacterium]
MKRAFTVLAMLLLIPPFVIGQTTGSKVGRISDNRGEEAIRKALSDFIAAWNTHDAKAFSMVFAEEADFTNVRGMSAHGRGEVEKFHAPRFATTFKDSHQKITDIKIRFIKPDVAAVDARWEMTGAKNAEGQDIPLRKGLLNFVMTKESDKWFITVMHNMNLPESP